MIEILDVAYRGKVWKAVRYEKGDLSKEQLETLLTELNADHFIELEDPEKK